jgi:hypothetical protein
MDALRKSVEGETGKAKVAKASTAKKAPAEAPPRAKRKAKGDPLRYRGRSVPIDATFGSGGLAPPNTMNNTNKNAATVTASSP